MTIISNSIETAIGSSGLIAVKDYISSFIKFENSIAFQFVNNDTPVYLYDSAKLPYRYPLYDKFISGLYRLSPYYNQVISKAKKDGFHLISDVAPDNFLPSSYYSEFYEKKNVSDEGMFFIKCGPNSLVYMIERINPSPAFSNEECIFLRESLDIVKSFLTRERIDASNTVPEQSGGGLNVYSNEIFFMLTEREGQVAHLILQGHSSKSSARLLGISPHTERVHRKRLYQKLGIRSHGELFRLFADRNDASASDRSK